MRELFSYFRSSAAFRVRIALTLKALPYQLTPVHLLRGGGEQHSADYLKLNPEGLVPYFRDEDGTTISQSLAIIEYLDEVYPQVPLLPKEAATRAWVRSIALAIACDIHPLNNLRVLQHLETEFDASTIQRDDWYRAWMQQGFVALEARLQNIKGGPYCAGAQLSLADICVVPQVFNAYRYSLDMRSFPRLADIYAYCMCLPAFEAASPAAQPDAPAATKS